MKVLITGLTLHNNKGGPALAYSLITQLKQVIPDAEFYLSVPGENPKFLEIERSLASKYDIAGIIGQVSVKEMLFPFYLREPYWSRRKKFNFFLKEIDLIVDLVALSYMDLSHHSIRRNLLSNLVRYSVRYFANLHNIPMIRWTQSYGPFSYPFTKYLARKDLIAQKHIFARGEASRQYLSEIISPDKIKVFPDIAITLPSDREYISNMIERNNIGQFITISPSSVLYQIQKLKHIDNIVEIINYLIDRYGYHILLVPHNLRTVDPTIENCDLEVSKVIAQKILRRDKVILLDEDLDPMQLKGIISQAKFHIGARYHSVVAALSTGVPAVSLAWHEKYSDLMRMFGCEQYVADEVADVISNIDIIEQNYEEIRNTLQKRQSELLCEIKQNLQCFLEMIHL